MNNHLVAITAFSLDFCMEDKNIFTVYDVIASKAHEQGATISEYLDMYICSIFDEYYHRESTNSIEDLYGKLSDGIAKVYVDIMGFTEEMEILGYTPWETIEEFDL